MSGIVRHLAGAVMVAAAALGMAALSHATLPVNRTDQAMLRVAWSARPERMESCRTLGDDELAALPQHMRQRVVCEGVTARYTFQLLRDGMVLDSAELRGGGLRHDRQIYVFRELRLPPGEARLEVRLTRVGGASTSAGPSVASTDSVPHGSTSSSASSSASSNATSSATARRDQRQEEEHRRRVEDEIPASLLLRETLTLHPREVVLVTYDSDEQRLRLVRDTLQRSRAIPR